MPATPGEQRRVDSYANWHVVFKTLYGHKRSSFLRFSGTRKHNIIFGPPAIATFEPYAVFKIVLFITHADTPKIPLVLRLDNLKRGRRQDVYEPWASGTFAHARVPSA